MEALLKRLPKQLAQTGASDGGGEVSADAGQALSADPVSVGGKELPIRSHVFKLCH